MADKKGAFYSYLTRDDSDSSAPLSPVSQPMSNRRTYDKNSGSRSIRHAVVLTSSGTSVLLSASPTMCRPFSLVTYKQIILGLVWYDEECERIFGGRVGWSKKRAGFVVATGRLGCISWTKESEGRGWWIQAVWWTFEWFLCIRATLKIRFTFCVIFGLNKWIKKDNAYLFIW